MSVDRIRPAVVSAAAELLVHVRAAAAGRRLVDLPTAIPRHHRGGPADPGAVDQALLLVLVQLDQLATAGGDTATARTVAAAAAGVLARAVLHPRDWPAAAARLHGLIVDARDLTS